MDRRVRPTGERPRFGSRPGPASWGRSLAPWSAPTRTALLATGTIECAIKVDHPFYLSCGTARAYLRATGFGIVAERLSDDGHWGFLARTGEPAEPDWPALTEGVDARLPAAAS